MSITSARNFIEKSGCGIITGILLAAIMGMSLASGQCSRAQQANNGQTPENSPTIVKVGDLTITSSELDKLSQDDLKRKEERIVAQLQGKPFEGFTTIQNAQFFRDTLGSAVDAAVNVELAKKDGVVLDDSAMLNEFMGEITKQVSEVRAQLTQQGMLPANASEEQYLAKFKEIAGGKTPQELIEANRSGLVDRLKDPALSLPLKGEGAQILWNKAEAGKITVSDQDLDALFDTVIFKSITLIEKPREDRKPAMEKILAEIKSGQMTFEAAMDKYSEKPLPKDKKKHSDTTDMLAWQFLLTDPNYGPLKNLKAGEISGVIDGVDGPMIFKYVSRKSDNEPKDFATNKEFYRSNHAKFMASTKFVRLQREAQQTMPKFEDEGFKLLYKLFRLERDPILVQDYLAIVEASEKVGDGPGKRPAVMAGLLAGNHVWRSLTGPAKTKFEDQHYIPSLEAFLALGPAPNINLNLVDLYLTRKSPKAAENLLRAAQSNASLSDAGKANYDSIVTKLASAKKAGLVKPDVLAQIEASLQRWLNDKKESDASVAKRKAEDEAQRKAAADAMAREKAAAEAARKQQGRPEKTPLPVAPPPR